MSKAISTALSSEQVTNAGTYSLSDIIFCIKNEDVLWQRAETEAHMDSVDLIMDTAILLEKANLTKNQHLVTMLRWEAGLTLKEVADILGVSPEAVRQSEQLAKNKMQAILDKWGEQ